MRKPNKGLETEKDIKSITDLGRLISTTNNETKDKFYCYRGQTNSNWSLTPSIFRLDYPEPIDIEEEIYSDFRNSVRLYSPLMVDFSNSWEMLCYAQHLGVPTRLLDWTINPLIAAFFAVEDAYNDPKTPGVIFVLDVTTYYDKRKGDRLGFRGVALSELRIDLNFLTHLAPIKDKDLAFLQRHDLAVRSNQGNHREIEIIQPPDIDHRIKVQGGLFSVSMQDDSSQAHNEILKDHMKMLTIPARHKGRIKTQLYRMGIHAGTIFPDLEGLGMYLTDRRDREAWVNKQRTEKKTNG